MLVKGGGVERVGTMVQMLNSSEFSISVYVPFLRAYTAAPTSPATTTPTDRYVEVGGADEDKDPVSMRDSASSPSDGGNKAAGVVGEASRSGKATLAVPGAPESAQVYL